ncbi:MAG: nuclear transport factor 2 family protein [Candidatus Cybelea sp.]
MQVRTIAISLSLALAPALVVAAASSPPPAILNLANAIIHGTNTDDPSGFSGLFTDDAVVVDENPPFVWRGAGAGVAWWHVVDAVTRKAKLTHLRATGVRTSEFKQSAVDAYLIQAMTITGTVRRKPFSEPGTMTYTLHNVGGKWLISTMVWTTKP